MVSIFALSDHPFFHSNPLTGAQDARANRMVTFFACYGHPILKVTHHLETIRCRQDILQRRTREQRHFTEMAQRVQSVTFVLLNHEVVTNKESGCHRRRTTCCNLKPDKREADKTDATAEASKLAGQERYELDRISSMTWRKRAKDQKGRLPEVLDLLALLTEVPVQKEHRHFW